MCNIETVNFNSHVIELIPNKDNDRWLLCFDGFLSPDSFCQRVKLDLKMFLQTLQDAGAYERNGNIFINDPDVIEPLIVALKLMV